MAAQPRRILVVEDEFVIALTLQETITRLGHVCIGPANTLQSGLVLAEQPLDPAILNMVVSGERIEPLCQRLHDRGVPFAFATGIDPRLDRSPWHARPRITKPYSVDDLTTLIEGLVPA